MADASPETASPDPLKGASPPVAHRVDPVALLRHLRRSSAPWLHGEIARRMGERLSAVKQQPTRVLDWWAPHSASTETLSAHYPQARIVPIGVDNKVADRPTAGKWWRRWTSGRSQADPVGTPPEPAGLLWANMMLHWVDDLPSLLQQWHAAVEVDGFLMFSAFGPDTLRSLHRLYAELGWGPPGSPWADMHDLGDALVHAGFADPVMDMERLTLTWADADALLAELRTLGCNTALSRFSGCRGRRWKQHLSEHLTERLARSDGRLHLEFEIVYGHAFRTATRPRVEAETRVSLQAMREMTRQRPR